MRPSVAAAWPAYCTRYEGRCNFMYLDTKYKVTTGTGNLIDSIEAAQRLPWLTKAGQPASPSQIAVEWRRVKALTSLAKKGGYAYRASAQLHLAEATLDALLTTVTASFWMRLRTTLELLESFPADAQLALLDLAWQNGAAFLDAKSGGQYVWPNMRAAVLARNWLHAAAAVPGTGDRAARRKRLFTNAATVDALGIDPTILWDDKTPVVPPTPDLEDEIMAMTDAQRKAFVREIADAVWARDVVPNEFTGNPDNPTVAPTTALKSLGESVAKIKAKLGVK